MAEDPLEMVLRGCNKEREQTGSRTIEWAKEWWI